MNLPRRQISDLYKWVFWHDIDLKVEDDDIVLVNQDGIIFEYLCDCQLWSDKIANRKSEIIK